MRGLSSFVAAEVPLTLARSPQKGEGTTNYTTLPDNAIFNDWLLINVHRRQLIRNNT